MPQNNFSQPRTVTASERGGLDIRNLVLLAILLAAGFILNMTVGKALSALTMGTLSPEFIIAAFCLEILIVRPKPAQAQTSQMPAVPAAHGQTRGVRAASRHSDRMIGSLLFMAPLRRPCGRPPRAS